MCANEKWLYVCVCRCDYRYIVRKKTLQGMSANGMTVTIYVTSQYKLTFDSDNV